MILLTLKSTFFLVNLLASNWVYQLLLIFGLMLVQCWCWWCWISPSLCYAFYTNGEFLVGLPEDSAVLIFQIHSDKTIKPFYKTIYYIIDLYVYLIYFLYTYVWNKENYYNLLHLQRVPLSFSLDQKKKINRISL